MKYLALFITASALLVIGIVIAVAIGGSAPMRITGISLMIIGTVLHGVNIGMQMVERRRDQV